MQAKCYVIDLHSLKKGARDKMLKKGTIIKVAGITLILMAGLPDVSYAAATGIDAGANILYKKLANIGKWVIIIKGGIDTIQNVTQGDLQSAKKNFLGYMVVYMILLGLPWGMGQIDLLFEDL